MPGRLEGEEKEEEGEKRDRVREKAGGKKD